LKTLTIIIDFLFGLCFLLPKPVKWHLKAIK
jgi:hypothetical protein